MCVVDARRLVWEWDAFTWVDGLACSCPRDRQGAVGWSSRYRRDARAGPERKPRLTALYVNAWAR
jgi:hypothetical protein